MPAQLLQLHLLRRSGAHGKAVTAMLPLASEAPGGPDMLLTSSAVSGEGCGLH